MTDSYAPKPEDRFTFGLWTVGNPGKDPFGPAVRPTQDPCDLVRMLGEIGAWGVNLHDNDLIPLLINDKLYFAAFSVANGITQEITQNLIQENFITAHSKFAWLRFK